VICTLYEINLFKMKKPKTLIAKREPHSKSLSTYNDFLAERHPKSLTVAGSKNRSTSRGKKQESSQQLVSRNIHTEATRTQKKGTHSEYNNNDEDYAKREDLLMLNKKRSPGKFLGERIVTPPLKPTHKPSNTIDVAYSKKILTKEPDALLSREILRKIDSDV